MTEPGSGLAIVTQIAEAHGEQIDLMASPDGGTPFNILDVIVLEG